MADDNTTVDPLNPSIVPPDAQAAANLIREKVQQAYTDEPSAKQELAESEAAHGRSKHQQFMYDLSQSCKDLAAIQTEWHNYYINLPDTEKHQVWQEFYSSQSAITGQTPQQLAEHKHAVIAKEHQPARLSGSTAVVATKPKPKAKKLRDVRSADEVQEVIRDKVSAGGKLQAKHHLQSLLFGLGVGFVLIFVFLFSFFNEAFIAPFVQPSRVAAATPLIVGTGSIAPTPTPEVIIPKINVEIPVDYNETSTDENAIENDLEAGVVHYPTTVDPGQVGNAAFFGHSSNNIFSKGKYKFAFVLLHTLVVGDTFYLTYHDKVYVYKVISRTVVEPNDVGVLGSVPGQTATATLITCDPPGTSLHRLIVVGQQISPDPSTDTAGSSTVINGTTPTVLPGNGPTLWTRFESTLAGKAVTAVILVIACLWVIRWINAPMRARAKAQA